MLRVGLTGGLGSGKSTAGRIFAAQGAHLLEADTLGRELMQPGHPVYAEIVRAFPGDLLQPDGSLDRRALAHLVFSNPERLAVLNAIVHPAVLARQAERMQAIFERDPAAIVIVESALIFETLHAGAEGWHNRFDRIILVSAPEELRVQRFVERSTHGRASSDAERSALEQEARLRIATQASDESKTSLCDYILVNDGSQQQLEWQVDRLWPLLVDAAQASHG